MPAHDEGPHTLKAGVGKLHHRPHPRRAGKPARFARHSADLPALQLHKRRRSLGAVTAATPSTAPGYPSNWRSRGEFRGAQRGSLTRLANSGSGLLRLRRRRPCFIREGTGGRFLGHFGPKLSRPRHRRRLPRQEWPWLLPLPRRRRIRGR